MLELEKVISKKTSVRQLRVAELIKEIIAEALAKKQIDAKVLIENFITVSKVNISPDLHNATVYVTAFNSSDIKNLLLQLNNLAPRFRAIINKNIRLKFSPQVIFRYDDTLENASKINELLDSLKD